MYVQYTYKPNSFSSSHSLISYFAKSFIFSCSCFHLLCVCVCVCHFLSLVQLALYIYMYIYSAVVPLAKIETGAHSWVIYTQLSGTRVAINIFLIAWTLISKSIDVAFAEAVVVVVGPIATAVTIAVDVGFIVPVVVVLQLLLLFVKYEPSIKSWDGTFVVTDFSSKFFGRFSWPEYLMSNWRNITATHIAVCSSTNSSTIGSCGRIQENVTKQNHGTKKKETKNRTRKERKEIQWLKIFEYTLNWLSDEEMWKCCPIAATCWQRQNRKTRYQIDSFIASLWPDCIGKKHSLAFNSAHFFSDYFTNESIFVAFSYVGTN